MIDWRGCSKCSKSFDGLYRGRYGCRACQRTEALDGSFADLTGPLGPIVHRKQRRPYSPFRAARPHVTETSENPLEIPRNPATGTTGHLLLRSR